MEGNLVIPVIRLSPPGRATGEVLRRWSSVLSRATRAWPGLDLRPRPSKFSHSLMSCDLARPGSGGWTPLLQWAPLLQPHEASSSSSSPDTSWARLLGFQSPVCSGSFPFPWSELPTAQLPSKHFLLPTVVWPSGYSPCSLFKLSHSESIDDTHPTGQTQF